LLTLRKPAFFLENTMSLNTVVIYGSARKNRQGIKAARFVTRQLEDRGHDVTLVDTLDYELPLLDRMYKEFEGDTAPEAMTAVGNILDAADGFVIVSGEYNHSVPAALKNLLDHYQKEYLYKPSAIVTYSAGPFAGVRALVNLRGILAELGTPSIPSSFPVSQVQSAFDDDGTAVEESYNSRVVKFLDEYEWYANAMQHGRHKGNCVNESPQQQKMCRG
jgi:NAD(P)H-dependent FMN reductase